MKKNVAGQVVVAQLASKTDGSAVTTGTTTVYVLGDGGTQATGSVASGAATHEGNGVWSYNPAQAETNYDHVAFTFVNTNAVNATVQVWPSFPQTGDVYVRIGPEVGSPSATISRDLYDIHQLIADNYARIGAPAGASLAADVAAVKAVLPAALVGGRIDASVGAMATDVLTSAALAASAVTEIQTGLSTLDAAAVRSAVGLASANLDTQLSTIAGYIDTEVGSIKTVTDKLNTTLTSVGSPGTYAFTAEALTLTPAAPTPAAVATAVRTELTVELGRVDVAVSTRLASASYVAPLDAAGTRTAVGLASANLDTQLSTIAGYIDTEVGSIKTVTDKLNTTLTSVGSPGVYAFTAEALTLTPSAGAAPSAATVASAVRTELTTELARIDVATSTRLASASYVAPLDAAGTRSAVGLASANLDTQLTTIAGYIDTEVGSIKTVTDKLNTTLTSVGSPNMYAFTAEALTLAPTGGSAPSAATVASAVRTELTVELGRIDVATSTRLASASYVAPLDAAGTRSAVGLASANLDTQLTTIAGYIDTEVGSIKTVTDKLNTTLTSVGSPNMYAFTAEALTLAPTGGSAPSAATIASAVWDEARSGHVTAGTFGEGIASVQGNVTGSVGSLGAQAKLDVNAEADTALADVGVTTTVTGRIDATVSSRLAAASYTAPDNATISSIYGVVDTEVAAIKAKTDNLPASPAATSDIPSASTVASAVWAYVVENSTSALQFMRGFAAALLGKASGGATTTMTFRDTADTKNRITATVDANGNRSSVTTDLT